MSTLAKPTATPVTELLGQHPLFSAFPRDNLVTLGSFAIDVLFGSGETIFREGEDANRFYLIYDGRVVLQAKSMTIDTLESGDVFGWSWLVPPYRWRFDARAVRRTRAVVLDGARLRERIDSERTLGFDLLTCAAMMLEQRLQSTRQRLLERLGGGE